MSKMYTIDSFKITLDDKLVKEAERCFVLEENDERSNYIYLKNLILAMCTPSLKDVGTVSFECIRRSYTDEELSKMVAIGITKNIKLYGGQYEEMRCL